MKLNLVVLSEGKTSGQAIPIKLSQFLIGRDQQCHLRPASPLISKRHCVLITKSTRVFIRDFDSTNGTFVNEERVAGQRELKDGDILKLGPITFRVQVEGAVAVDKPTPLPANRKDELSEDDAAAAMLLVADEGATSTSTEDTGEGSIPAGTTIMEMPAMGADEGTKEGTAKPDDKKAPQTAANTSSAAAAILAKYARRQRN
jgi:pSer/pThr/pTyr-binding forkhead associated (FHA) protein